MRPISIDLSFWMPETEIVLGLRGRSPCAPGVQADLGEGSRIHNEGPDEDRHQIVPDAFFPRVFRQAYWVHSDFMSVGRSDLNHVDARVALAAARDLAAMAERIPYIAGALTMTVK